METARSIPATLIRSVAPANPANAGVREDGDVNQDDVEKLLEQQAAILSAFDRQSVRMDAIASKADSAYIDMNGLMGNDGVKATQARLLESHRSTRRELQITRRQIKDVGESLRAELRSLTSAIASKAKADSDERIAERTAAAKEAGAREEASKRDQRTTLERVAYVLAAMTLTGAGGTVIWWVWWVASKELGVR
jgi:hypothetical protein